eukprot:3962809-Prymnesium_polylepis.1
MSADSLQCDSCGKAVDVPSFDRGTVIKVTGPCGYSTPFRSPWPVSEQARTARGLQNFWCRSTDLKSARAAQDVEGLATFAIDVAPPADGVPPSLPRLPCLQLAEFALVDGFGDPVTLEWLARRLGGPGARRPRTKRQHARAPYRPRQLCARGPPHARGATVRDRCLRDAGRRQRHPGSGGRVRSECGSSTGARARWRPARGCRKVGS